MTARDDEAAAAGEAAVDGLAATLARPFADRRLALRALTRRSYAHEAGGEHNERLEFLGDAVLQLAVTALLFEAFPDADEGTLSHLRTRIVRTERIAEIARRLGLAPLLRVGRGEATRTAEPRILANAFESVVGALYLEEGLPACQTRIAALIAEDLAAFAAERAASAHDASKHARNRLQELLQARGRGTPRYEDLGKVGPDHQPLFEVAVYAGDERLAVGLGASKQKAAQDAAVHALAALAPPPEEP